VSHSRAISKKNKISPGQQRLPWAWDVWWNQIPEEWHRVAVKFRRANGPLVYGKLKEIKKLD